MLTLCTLRWGVAWLAQGPAIDSQRKTRMYRGALVVMVLYDVTNYQSFVNATTKVSPSADRCPRSIPINRQ